MAVLYALSSGKPSIEPSKTLRYLSDLDHEFRSRADVHLEETAKEQFNSQMDHIISMFNKHETDESIKCYNRRISVNMNLLEGSDSVMDYASALTALIDGAFGNCENYIDIAGRAAELRWSLLSQSSSDY